MNKKKEGFRTVYGCSDCVPCVPLHRGPCFEVYHDNVASGKWAAYKPKKYGLKKPKTKQKSRSGKSNYKKKKKYSYPYKRRKTQ